MAPMTAPECRFGCQARNSVERITPPPQWYCQCCGKSWPVEEGRPKGAAGDNTPTGVGPSSQAGYWDGQTFHVGDVADY